MRNCPRANAKFPALAPFLLCQLSPPALGSSEAKEQLQLERRIQGWRFHLDHEENQWQHPNQPRIPSLGHQQSPAAPNFSPALLSATSITPVTLNFLLSTPTIKILRFLLILQQTPPSSCCCQPGCPGHGDNDTQVVTTSSVISLPFGLPKQLLSADPYLPTLLDKEIAE